MRSFGFIPFTTIFLSLFFAIPICQAQQRVPPRPSPLAVASVRYKNHYLKITYSQPHKNGRQIFGKLVPYGKVWRTGANEATELTTLKDISINGSLLKAGTYSIFTIPDEDQWTVIINSETGLWGSYNYNEALDVIRFVIPVQKISGDLVFEAFTIQLDHQNDLVNLLLMWDKTKISIPIKLNI